MVVKNSKELAIGTSEPPGRGWLSNGKLVKR